MRQRWIVWGICLGTWTVLLLLPRSQFEVYPIDEIAERHRYFISKSLHVLAYAFLAVLTGWLRVPPRWRWLPLFFLMGHASLSEFAQGFVMDRTPKVSDVGLDHLGVALGILLSWKWWTHD